MSLRALLETATGEDDPVKRLHNKAAFLKNLDNCADELLAVAEIAEKRPNKFGPHYMIWMDEMDVALRAFRERERKG